MLPCAINPQKNDKLSAERYIQFTSQIFNIQFLKSFMILGPYNVVAAPTPVTFALVSDAKLPFTFHRLN